MMVVRALAFVIALLPSAVLAAPPENADPALHDWFNSLRNPVTGMSCCAESDGHLLNNDEWRVAGDHYQVRIGNQWHDVPPRAVLNGVPNPTGGAVAFWPPRGGTIYCFLRPTDS